MTVRKFLFAALPIGACGVLAALAAAQQNAPSPGPKEPELAAGQRIATSGDPARNVVACVTCHGAQGEGNAAAGFPRLAGQSAWYMSEQLASYVDGRRKNPIMEPIAKGLDDDQRQAVSAYYAGLEAPAAPAAGGQAPTQEARKRSETLYLSGDETLRIQGCVNCHGPGGAGEPPAYPYLGGQHAGYLAAALREFKSGARATDPSGQMPYIARQLSDSDIDAVSAYLAQLPPPEHDDTQTAAIRQRAAQGAATPSLRQSGPSAPEGTGTEQGAPLTGGGQGPGGGGGGSGSGPSGSGTGR